MERTAHHPHTHQLHRTGIIQQFCRRFGSSSPEMSFTCRKSHRSYQEPLRSNACFARSAGLQPGLRQGSPEFFDWSRKRRPGFPPESGFQPEKGSGFQPAMLLGPFGPVYGSGPDDTSAGSEPQ